VERPLALNPNTVQTGSTDGYTAPGWLRLTPDHGKFKRCYPRIVRQQKIAAYWRGSKTTRTCALSRLPDGHEGDCDDD